MVQGSNETRIFLNLPCSAVIRLQEGEDTGLKGGP